MIGSSESHTIVILGAGNVSTHISRHFHLAGHQLLTLYNRSEQNGILLAKELDCPLVTSLEELPDQADFYVVCLPDRVIPEVTSVLERKQGIWLHTAGAGPLELLEGSPHGYGVLYPLQSLSRERSIAFRTIPILIEGSNPAVESQIQALADSISDRVMQVSSADRLGIHMAAVFANNFSNHMVRIAQQILEGMDLEWELMSPLLEETFQKLQEHKAQDVQTGPAVRGDHKTMEQHLELLRDHPEWQKLYTFISREIERSRK